MATHIPTPASDARRRAEEILVRRLLVSEKADYGPGLGSVSASVHAGLQLWQIPAQAQAAPMYCSRFSIIT
jgi:hypothetical protein